MLLGIWPILSAGALALFRLFGCKKRENGVPEVGLWRCFTIVAASCGEFLESPGCEGGCSFVSQKQSLTASPAFSSPCCFESFC